jgi:hypothetical protein
MAYLHAQYSVTDVVIDNTLLFQHANPKYFSFAML